MVRAPAAWALHALLATAPLLAANGPTYEIGRDGVLVVGALPAVLSRPEVKPHLTTGLTTSFLLTVTASGTQGRKVKGAARIDLRWEPWDEVFFVRAVGADRRVRRETLPSLDRLVGWWRAVELPVAIDLPADRWQVKVELSVVPFSQSEQLDAQRWFASAPASKRPKGSRSAKESPA